MSFWSESNADTGGEWSVPDISEYAQQYQVPNYGIETTPQTIPLVYNAQPEPTAQPETSWLTGARNWAQNNPKDVIGMGLGLAGGIAGLATGNNQFKAPDMSGVNATNAQLLAQINQMRAQGQPLNQAALARLQDLLSGKYGEYNDSNALRMEANKHIQQLINTPSQMLPEDQAKLTQLDQEYASKGLLGSSLYTKARAQLQQEIQNTQDARKNANINTLQGVSAGQNQQQNTIYGNVQNAVNASNAPDVAALSGLSSLAERGLQAATTANQANVLNTEQANQRAGQLASVGGNIFGRALAPSYADFLKTGVKMG